MSDDPMADGDPMADPDRCTATASSTGERCKQPAIQGGNVCRFHGGNSPQAQAKAQERLDAMADSVTAKLQERLDGVFRRMDTAETHEEYVKLLREARQLTTMILDRTGHGKSETKELEHSGEVDKNVELDGESRDAIRDALDDRYS